MSDITLVTVSGLSAEKSAPPLVHFTKTYPDGALAVTAVQAPPGFTNWEADPVSDAPAVPSV